MKTFKIILTAFFISIVGLIVYSNFNLYHTPSFILIDGKKVNVDLVKQLDHLKKSLKEGIADELQSEYPEGYFFANLMYGLTWCEFAFDLPDGSSLKNKAVNEAIYSLHNLEQEYCQQSFTKNLPLRFGAFYFCWTNYLRAKILTLSKTFPERDRIISDFSFNCDTLSKIILISESPFFESYPNQYWPADILPGITSLSLHDKLFNCKYDSTIIYWFNKVESMKKYGETIFPHSVNQEGVVLQSARGSSLGLILILLKEIPEIDAGSIYNFYDRAYRTSFLGLPMIHEYCCNNYGEGDVDSGPVIWGYGSVATIIGAGVFKRFGELDLADRFNKTIEFLGFPYEDSERKVYLAGQIPMADFFIAWVKSLKTLDYKTINTNADKHWRLLIHISSFLTISILVVLILFINRKK